MLPAAVHVPPRLRAQDIFFLEVCMYSQLCKKTAGPGLFDLQVGEEFHCDFSPFRFEELQQWLTSDLAPEAPGSKVCYNAWG